MITPATLQTITEVMNVMAQTELRIAELYRTCASLWPEDEDFWLEAVVEEEKHARNIEQMARIIASKPERFEAGRPFNVVAIRTIQAGLEKNLEKVKNGEISRGKMLNLARDIEASIIEKSYAEIVRTQDIEYRNLVGEIVSETFKHKKDIEQRIQALQSGG